MKNDAFILTLAYPETIVMHADEWYSALLKYIGIGNKTHVRAGHAAMVLIEKATGILEYHDFGRYITSEPNGRVRGKSTDAELGFHITAVIENNDIKNLNDILIFLGTHPKLTHGDGKLVASVCKTVNYKMAKESITKLQHQDFIRYAAFVKKACNCARFVTSALIGGITDKTLKKRLIKSQWFTPSTVGNVVLADTENYIYEVSEEGVISKFDSSVRKENIKYFLDRLPGHQPNYVGTLEPKDNAEKQPHAQWLSGIAAGAWFELNGLGDKIRYNFRRISPYGNIDIDAEYLVNDMSFNIKEDYQFIHYSNCKFFHIKQYGKTYRFDKVDCFN
ncbi:DUF6695 family protein [Ichthyenterobacterium sp. W332]|uniref:DUF6695 family protein n=1 Tax=Microcosmobacter mediterraneus TaxID=3075607 RepID=A0ABU2YMH9_9FLAO|nr:DUF6695 family protein [Ichthyenterobacterium sp. W332]MDT0559351.1 DUF6695 family protein [Ichthyenterobacterium sp. W332]